jgi:hypothetical protein
MNARFIRFGEIEIDGARYTEDVVIAHGSITPRDKSPSRKHKARFHGHTPLSAREAIPWDCQRLIIGTGAQGLLPVMKKVYQRAEERGVELVVVPTEQACRLLSEADLTTTSAILHVTC